MSDNKRVIIGFIVFTSIVILIRLYQSVEDNEFEEILSVARYEQEEQGYYSAETMSLLLEPLSKTFAEDMKNITRAYRQKQRENFHDLELWYKTMREYRRFLESGNLDSRQTLIRKWGLSVEKWEGSAQRHIQDATFRKKLEEVDKKYNFFPTPQDINDTEAKTHISHQIKYLETKQSELAKLKEWVKEEDPTWNLIVWTRISDYVFLKTRIESEDLMNYIENHKEEISEDIEFQEMYSKFQALSKNIFHENPKNSKKKESDQLGENIQEDSEKRPLKKKRGEL